MKVITDKKDFHKIAKGGVLTIGNFDGVHVGHQEILLQAGDTARRRGVGLTIMTFEPHPVAVLFPEKTPKVLTPLDYKLHLLNRSAQDCIIVLEDNIELLKLSADAFVQQILIKEIAPSVIVEGDDFNFGAGRSGNIEILKKIGKDKGFTVEVVPTREIKLSTGQSIRVSSTIIRYMLESGHVSDAAVALGRRFRFYGRIISGRGKGSELGFPTLNMERTEQILPAEGVYAGYVEIGDSPEDLFYQHQQWPAVFSIGQARTFGEAYPLLIEAHLLVKPDIDMADKWMAIDFVQRLRCQHKFSSIEALAKQIAVDCEQARHLLTKQ